MTSARRPPSRARAVAGLLALAALSACHAKSADAPDCLHDDDCGAGACVSGTCLSRALPPSAWDIEVAPTTDSTAAFTELLDAAGPANAYDLQAAPKVTVTGALATDVGTATLKAAHVVLKVPALIPGRPALQYETDLLPPGPDGAVTFSLAVSSACLGRTGTLQILPTMPDDATHAPATFTMPVAPSLSVAVPTKTVIVKGRVLTALGDPVGGLIARAFSSGALVSNVAATTGTSDADRGAFSLMVRAAADGTPPSPLTVEVEPAMSESPQPHFWTKPLMLSTSTDLGDVHMPAYGQPTTFKFAFQGDDGAADGGADGGTDFANAVVRARTVLLDDATSTIDFVRSGVTDSAGSVSLDLLPGSTVAKRLYDIAVVPPAGSPWAATCLEMFPVVTGGLQPTTMLRRRAVVSGLVEGSDGLPVGGVVVLATRTAASPATRCDALAGSPQAVTTSRPDGTFSFPLDPGVYTVDLDPPAGAPYPRLTRPGLEVGVGVDGATADAWRLRLPVGALLEGTVRSPAGKPVPLAGVRFYAPSCADAAACPTGLPTLEAQARADANGHFRAVIPVVPAPAP
ncbi:MAG TPA: carboxypeptidase-like regulatory domain-containing protein [Polyangia bacterium]|nr:carboxypeptidase-like regulatory domain-containing protein [Polyangia bacterium]